MVHTALPILALAYYNSFLYTKLPLLSHLQIYWTSSSSLHLPHSFAYVPPSAGMFYSSLVADSSTFQFSWVIPTNPPINLVSSKYLLVVVTVLILHFTYYYAVSLLRAGILTVFRSRRTYHRPWHTGRQYKHFWKKIIKVKASKCYMWSLVWRATSFFQRIHEKLASATCLPSKALPWIFQWAQGRKKYPHKALHPTISARLWEAPAHWPHRKYAREWGRGSGSLGNIPEIAAALTCGGPGGSGAWSFSGGGGGCRETARQVARTWRRPAACSPREP